MYNGKEGEWFLIFIDLQPFHDYVYLEIIIEKMLNNRKIFSFVPFCFNIYTDVYLFICWNI